MAYFLSLHPHTLQFKTPAGTSRGVYRTHKVWYLHLTSSLHPGRVGIGECAPLPDLSAEYSSTFEEELTDWAYSFQGVEEIDWGQIRHCSSLLFALETALLHLQRGDYAFWDTPFARAEQGIPINALIWMGKYDDMLHQIEQKLTLGVRCIKLKIGAIELEQELALLRHIRNHFSHQELSLRVDANGAFSPKDVAEKLDALAKYDIHSIEQPIKPGQWDEMHHLAETSPIPIALDEELIGTVSWAEKGELLEAVAPQFIVLKPTLHGGIRGCEEWIEEANKRNIGWWITSALESNIGLNAIAQWCATLPIAQPQGLGTGQLFTNNVPLPLIVEKDTLWYKPSEQ